MKSHCFLVVALAALIPVSSYAGELLAQVVTTNPTPRQKVQSARAGSVTKANPLNAARQNHTATLLPSGKVLVVGGFSGRGSSGAISTTELYDPATGKWTKTGGMTNKRACQTTTLLPNGKVLAVGGIDDRTNSLTNAELYDPATGMWTATGALHTGRYFHTATLLPSGKVLVAGGGRSSGSDVLSSAEVYNPATGTWTETGALAAARQNHTATLLANGKVLVAGGMNSTKPYYLTSVEVYDAANGTWSGTGGLTTKRALHTATLLPNGSVLFAGGDSITSVELYAGLDSITSAELYDPTTGTCKATGGPTTKRTLHTATLLPSGKVLAAGGGDFSFHPLSSAELYDPTTGTWAAADWLTTKRASHTATPLPSGQVLLVGGYNNAGVSIASAELYNPAGGTAAGALPTAREGRTAPVLPDGPDSLVGTYSAEVKENGGLAEFLRIKKVGGKYRLYFRGDDSPIEVKAMGQKDMDELFGEAFKVKFTALTDGQGATVVKFPDGWKTADFECGPGYWFLSVAGPLELHKK